MRRAIIESESFPKAIFVHGEAGIDKTSLINQALCAVDTRV